LRRVKESDIPPADESRDADSKNGDKKRVSAYSYNKFQRGAIQGAMHIARSRVQFPKEGRELNMQEFID
jgi:hypothetical protein